jgi:hypothetical protein
MADLYDMQCGDVPDFKGNIDKYIDPNNTGKEIHKEIKEVLTNEAYLILKKILLTSNDLDEYYKTEQHYTTPASSRAEIMKRFNETKKLNKLLDKASNKFSSTKEFCDTFDFNDEKIPQGTAKDIPLLNTIHGKQIVLGRQRNLFDYYNDKSKFITLNSKFWDPKYLNDIFIECAVIKTNDFTEPNLFPIRIVLTENLFDEPDKLHNITQYDKNYQITTVLSKELCQILKYTDFEVFQSAEFPNIFFIGKSGLSHNPAKFIKISSNTDRYILKYYKYKQKYLALQKSLQ